MTTLITAEQLSACMPRCQEPEVWAPLLDEKLFTIGVVEPEHIAAFIAQTGHESVNFNVLEENLNYSADGLRRIFGKYFRDVTPEAYARNPRKIASRVYANRMGNGSESTGDGWRFRGRGILQVTGRFNYEKCSSYIFNDRMVLLDDPDMLLEKEYALMSAIWFWDVNQLKDIRSFTDLTKRINGGTHGIEDRILRYKRALKVLTN